MFDKKTVVILLVGVAIGVVAGPKLRTLPLVGKLPTAAA